MYEFYFKKLYSNINFISKDSPEIIQECIKETPDLIYQKIFELFMKFYSSAIANFMVQHMTTGGVYLIGGLTKALLIKIKDRDVLKDWKERHPDMVKIVDKIPLMFSNEIDLGLKGSFFMAKRLISHRANKVYELI
jgi:glucokinase